MKYYLYIKKCKNEYIIRNLRDEDCLGKLYITKLYYPLENVSAEGLYDGGQATGVVIEHLMHSYKKMKHIEQKKDEDHDDLLVQGYRAVPINTYNYDYLFRYFQ